MLCELTYLHDAFNPDARSVTVLGDLESKVDPLKQRAWLSAEVAGKSLVKS